MSGHGCLSIGALDCAEQRNRLLLLKHQYLAAAGVLQGELAARHAELRGVAERLLEHGLLVVQRLFGAGAQRADHLIHADAAAVEPILRAVTIAARVAAQV